MVAVAEVLRHQFGVVAEPAGDVAVHPAALVLQGAGQIPVIQRGERLQATLQHTVQQAVVKIDAGLVDRAGTLGNQPRPGEGEAIAVEAAVADEVEILGPAIVVVAGDAAVVGILHIARRGGEGVPDAGAATVELAALDLIGGGRGAKHEIRPELAAVNRKHVPSGGR
jgi:hypothetical protein